MRLSPNYLALGLMLPAVAMADETAKIAYHALAELPTKFDAVPVAERDRVRLILRVISKNADHAPIVMTAEMPDRKIEIRVAANGDFELPRDPALAAADPTFMINQPKGTLDLDFEFAALLPNPVDFRYADLALAAGQANKLVEREAGMMSFLAPEVKGMLFTCDGAPGCVLTVHHASGDRAYPPDAAGIIALKFDKELAAENPRITATRPFAAVEADL